MYPKEVSSRIKIEIEQIEKQLEDFYDLFQKCQEREPNIIEINALASVLHSFYTGIEKIFVTVAKLIDKKVPKNDQWHSELLKMMGQDSERRDRVISETLQSQLIDYLAFRHVFRNSYSHTLKWDRMGHLVRQLTGVWEQLKVELQLFLDSLSEE